MAPKLKPEADAILKAIIDKATDDTKTKIPGISFAVSNSKGEDLFSYASGYTDASGEKKLTKENTFWIASATKPLVGVACLQLVEQGKLRLDDSEQVETLVPEIANLPVVTRNDDGSLRIVPKKNGITLRQLLSHTAGFGYTFFNDIYKEWGDLFNLDNFSVDSIREFQFPLLFEPGTDWEYGLGIDWAGVVLERYTGQKLGEYIHENIVVPLGMNNSSFEPTPKDRETLVEITVRDPENGTNEVIPHPFKKFFIDGEDKVHSGGAGFISKPVEYLKFLSTLLNDGVSPITGKRILKKETVDLVFENQIPQFPNFGRKGIISPLPRLANDIPDIYPEPGSPPQGWGLTFFLFTEKGQTGHAAGTAFWAGITNIFYWVDRASGLTGFIGTDVLPFADSQVLSTWVQLETAVYENISN